MSDNINNYYLRNPALPTANAEYEWTPEMVEAFTQAKKNITYFAEKFFYIINLDRGKEVIKLYTPQKRVLKSLVKHNRVVLLSSRQMGKSTLICIFALWYTCFNKDKSILIVANKEKTAIELLSRIRTAYELLPNWLKPGVKDYSKTNVVFSNDSRIFVSTTATTAGRSSSINCLLIDECVHGSTTINIRNKKTNEIKPIEIKDLYGSSIAEWEVLTPDGWSDFSGIKKTKRDKSIKFEFSDNSIIICTPEHKIKSNKNRFKKAINYHVGDVVYNNITIVNKTIFSNSDLFYDLLNVKKKNQYFTNNIISHNCAHIDKHKEDEFIKSVMPVISSSSKTKIFMVSTSNGTSNHFYHIYTGAERGDNGWHPEKVLWQEIPGRDAKWRAAAIADLGSIEAFEQEYNCAFIETGETAIDKELIANFRENACLPTILNTSEYKVWETPDPKGIYLMGIDVSDGVGGAASCIQGLNATDLTNIRQSFTYWNRFLDTSHFAKEIFEIAKQWGNPPLSIERNSMGGEVVNFLTGRPYNYERIVSYSSDKAVDYEKGGIYSSTNVKYEGISNFRYWLNSIRAVEIFDIATIQELETFVKYPNGTWRGQPGGGVRDDRVMSLVWALFTLHTPIAEGMFEIMKYDERGKPLKIKKNYYDDEKYYGLKQYRHDYGDDDFIPAFVGKKSSYDDKPEMEDLVMDGWKLWIP